MELTTVHTKTLLKRMFGQTRRVISSASTTASGAVRLQGRSDYKRTWEHLAGTTSDDAKIAVSGYTDEEQVAIQGAYTVDLLDRLVGIQRSDVFLEIGCGFGRVGALLAPRCGHWIGTDISGKMIGHTRERLRGLPNVTLIELRQSGLPEVADASVDVVYCTVVFMHLYEWDRFRYVQEAHRVLRPGGRCYFDNITFDSAHGWSVFMASASYPVDQRPAHISMVSSREELRTYLTKAGFLEVAIHDLPNGRIVATGRKCPELPASEDRSGA